jgi:hypothetical protein
LLRESADEARFEIRLDVQQPYLNDHRPGGAPLLSTVMGLEAVVAAARRRATFDTPAWLSDVCVCKPFIAAGDGPHVVEVWVARVAPAFGAVFDCTLLSSIGAGEHLEHLRARVTFAERGPAGARAAPRHAAADGRPSMVEATPLSPATSVSQVDVYDLLFHGPAFQVVAGAHYREGSMTCPLTVRLPPSHDRAVESEVAPRLIELALQCAGLLELAQSGRMMIPHSIAWIDRFLPLDVDHGAPLAARATRSAAADPAIDIEVTDELGRLVLRVERYRTVLLPFAMNEGAAARLRRHLLGCAPEPRGSFTVPER